MANIVGVNLPKKKSLYIALSYIYGIGEQTGLKICKSLNIDKDKKVESLSETEISEIRQFIEKNYKVETDLKREIASNINALKSIRCYRGLRHEKHLPVRGQRTHSNAETRRKGK